jgi:hypothetical protein
MSKDSDPIKVLIIVVVTVIILASIAELLFAIFT